MFIIDDLLIAMAAAEAATAATAATAAATALPAAGMAATGGLLGTGAGAFGASALPAGLGTLEGLSAGGGLLGSAGQGIGGSMAAAGMPASTAPFSAMLSPSTLGSYGLGDATASGMAQPLTMGDHMGMFAKRMMPSGKDMMLNGMKMAGQAMSQPQQQAAPQGRAQSPYQGQQQQPLAPMSQAEAQRKKRDELLRQMMGIR